MSRLTTVLNHELMCDVFGGEDHDCAECIWFENPYCTVPNYMYRVRLTMEKICPD